MTADMLGFLMIGVGIGLSAGTFLSAAYRKRETQVFTIGDVIPQFRLSDEQQFRERIIVTVKDAQARHIL
jgi:hypothetical protein